MCPLWAPVLVGATHQPAWQQWCWTSWKRVADACEWYACRPDLPQYFLQWYHRRVQASMVICHTRPWQSRGFLVGDRACRVPLPGTTLLPHPDWNHITDHRWSIMLTKFCQEQPFAKTKWNIAFLRRSPHSNQYHIRQAYQLYNASHTTTTSRGWRLQSSSPVSWSSSEPWKVWCSQILHEQRWHMEKSHFTITVTFSTTVLTGTEGLGSDAIYTQ